MLLLFVDAAEKQALCLALLELLEVFAIGIN
jgi:hypothetical protein